jgi:predicted nucleic acid-binding protein
MIALDTNLLVYAYLAAIPEHQAARRAIESAVQNDAGWGIALPTVTEFWCVTTHPRCSSGPAKPAQARTFITNLLEDGGGNLWQPGADFGQRLFQLADDLKVLGPRIFDLQIALVAFENGATEIWSHDRNFVTVPGLHVRDPLP